MLHRGDRSHGRTHEEFDESKQGAYLISLVNCPSFWLSMPCARLNVFMTAHAHKDTRSNQEKMDFNRRVQPAMFGCLERYLFDVSAAGWLHGLPLAVC